MGGIRRYNAIQFNSSGWAYSNLSKIQVKHSLARVQILGKLENLNEEDRTGKTKKLFDEKETKYKYLYHCYDTNLFNYTYLYHA